MITAAMRDLLIEHIDGPIQVVAGGRRGTLWKAAFDRGFIIGNAPSRPRFSELTVLGRQTLAKVLADWADAMVRAGYDQKIAPKGQRDMQMAA